MSAILNVEGQSLLISFFSHKTYKAKQSSNRHSAKQTPY